MYQRQLYRKVSLIVTTVLLRQLMLISGEQGKNNRRIKISPRLRHILHTTCTSYIHRIAAVSGQIYEWAQKYDDDCGANKKSNLCNISNIFHRCADCMDVRVVVYAQVEKTRGRWLRLLPYTYKSRSRAVRSLGFSLKTNKNLREVFCLVKLP